MSFYLPNDYLNRYGFWSERPVSKALKNFDDYYNTTSSNKFMKYCRKVIFDLESKNIALRRTLRDEKEKKMEWNWEALVKRTKKGDFTFLKHLPNYNDFDWESLSKKKTKPEPQVQDKPKFETGIAVWYVNPNKGVPRIAQIQKVYTDDPTGVYYDVKFR